MSAGAPRPRYFLDRDESGHWYIVPVAKRAEWNKWRDLDGDDFEPDAPQWAKRLALGFQMMTFTDPQEGP